MTKQKLLITGISGLLGNNLGLYFREKYDVLGVYNRNPVIIPGIRTDHCDLESLDAAGRMLAQFKPDVVIHCASMTNVDQCEAEPEQTEKANVEATRNLAEQLPVDAQFVYISTDLVYSGGKSVCSEDDVPEPRNIYGRTKLQGEQEALKHANSVVLRTNIFGWNIQEKHSLAEWVLNALQDGNEITGFDDVFFSSIYTFELAPLIEKAIQSRLRGVYNCGSSNSCSKYEFAQKIATLFDLDSKNLKRGSIDDVPLKAERVKSLTLNVSKIEKALDYRLPAIDYSLERFYRDYHRGLPAEIKKHNQQERPGFERIPYGRQWIDSEDIRAVVSVLESDWITQGPNIIAFEKALSESCNAEHAIAFNSGTSALHAACLSVGVGPGDEVITSPITFVASANSAAYCGATPVFADIDPQTYNIDPAEIEKKLTDRTKAVIPVHFAGQSCDMQLISQIVRSAEKRFGHKIYIIEDACHALGSLYQDRPVGSCQYSDLAAMSFHPVKHITTGEGGAILTNQPDLAERCQLFRSHGITSDPEVMGNSHGPWYYEQIELGYNYRITDIQCVLGSSQIKRLPEFIRRRREIVDQYNAAFKGLPNVTIPFEGDDCISNFHLYVLLFDFKALGKGRIQLKEELQSMGVLSQIHYIPVHIQPYYRQHFNTRYGDMPCAEEYYEKCMSLPLFPAMDEHDVRSVISAVKKVVGGA